MSTHSSITRPAAAELLSEFGISSQRAKSLQELWQALELLCIASRAQANRMAADHGLSNPQFTVFCVLSASEPMTMGQIGEHSDLPTSSLTALVDRLVALGIVSRSAHPSDRRAIQVQLTDAGRDLASRVEADTLRATAQINAGIEDRQIEEASDVIRTLLAGYGQYVARLGRMPARPPARRARADRKPAAETDSDADGGLWSRAHLDGASPGHGNEVASHSRRDARKQESSNEPVTPEMARRDHGAGRS